jgi:hypothetical protein
MIKRKRAGATATMKVLFIMANKTSLNGKNSSRNIFSKAYPKVLRSHQKAASVQNGQPAKSKVEEESLLRWENEGGQHDNRLSSRVDFTAKG